jgi:hypothetical protein
MPTIAKLPSGSWRAQVRRKGRYVSETFLRRDDALRWSRLAELSVDRNETPVSSRIGRITKFGELVRLHIEDMTAVEGRDFGDAAAANLGALWPQRRSAATIDRLSTQNSSEKTGFSWPRIRVAPDMATPAAES